MNKGGGINFFVNPFTYLVLRNKNILEVADSIHIDGWLMCFLLKLFKICSVPRKSFDNSSLAPIVFDSAQRNKLKVALVGSDQFVIDTFSAYLKKTYPSINIIYSRNGFFNTAEDVAQSISTINRFGADLVIVGMGAGKQEEYLIDLIKSGWRGTGYTCGGFMHQTAKSGHNYYPKWANDYNLRFLYRMYCEPKLMKRYVFYYPKFLFIFLYDTFNYKLRRG
jgi:N-acetylglucosaminyldiphosphoundecaprenol N-acetyl-beta-D-mannosaminyltransferase